MDLKNVSAVVTGGASGLGAATAAALSRRGTQVVIADLDDERGETHASAIGAIYMRTDVRDTGEVVAAVDAAVELGPLRVLVNCAGISRPMRTIGRGGTYDSAQPLEKFEHVIGVNLVGTFNVIRIAAVAMSQNEPLDDGARGVIVNTASVAAFDGQVGQASYSASKAAIVGMTLPIARDLAAIGVRVNTIAPGLIDTPIYDSMDNPDEFKAALKRDVLFPDRLGRPEEFSRMVLEIATNDYMNAEVVRVDGGVRLRAK